jgi:LysR family transcriptional regulator of gallate degradation
MSEKVNPRHLRALIAVVLSGSITKAAEHLLRAPSAVARSIRELESSLSVPLFERQPSGMLPTPFGEAAFSRAQRIAAEFEAARQEFAALGFTSSAPLFSMLVTERQLATLAKLRELRHMPSVARSLSISQPAVSATVSHFESSLGTALFRRTAKGMVATEAGEMLLFRIRRVLVELRRLEGDVAQRRGETAGRLMIAALPSSRTLLLPMAIARLVGRYPQIQVSVVDAPFEILFADMQSGEIDFILTGISPEYLHKDFRVQTIGRDRLVVVARKDHPLARKARVRLQDLLDYPWVLRESGAPSRELLNGVFRALGIASPRIAVQAGDLGILRGLLMNSDMLSAVSAQHLLYEVQSGTITVLDIDLKFSERDVGFVLRRDAQPSALCLLLMEEIRALAQSMYSA